MFCPKCGTKLEGNFVFCPKCGANIKAEISKTVTSKNIEQSNDNLKTTKKTKKKVIITIGIAIAIIAAVLVALFAINNMQQKKIIGHWEVTEKRSNYDSNFENYPENDFYIYENGEVTADGYSGTYYIYDKNFIYGRGKISMTFYAGTYSYTYNYSFRIYGDRMELSDIDEDDSRYSRVTYQKSY